MRRGWGSRAAQLGEPPLVLPQSRAAISDGGVPQQGAHSDRRGLCGFDRVWIL
jgi:hypothetical protein